MKIIRLFVIVGLFTTTMYAQLGNLNFDKMRYGQELPWQTARMLGLAGSGLALQGAYGNAVDNPALLAGAESGLGINAGFAVDKSMENREYPYYDSFVGFNDYGSYAFNNNWYYGAYFNARYVFKHLMKNTFAVQTGIVPFLDFRYHYVEEVRSPTDKTDQLLGYNWIKQDGLLNLSYVALGYQILPDLSAGVTVGTLWGSIDSTQQTEPKAGKGIFQQTQISRKRSLNKQPVLFNAGIHFKVNDRLTLGYSFRAPYEIQFNSRSKSSEDSAWAKYNETITYPMRMGLGLDYRFQNILQARVLLDFYYEFWSQFKDNRSSTANYRDTYTIRAGVEHIFFDKLPFRIGFAFNQVPQNHDLTRTLLTIGTGWNMGGLSVDASGGLVNQQYFQKDIFPNSIFGLPDRTDLDRVTWTQYYLRVDVSFRLFE